jgi:Family of unknown function (DUF5694)
MKQFCRIFVVTLCAVFPAVCQQAPADKSATPARAEVLVLGVYHMANPGRDIFNMQADDVLAPKRQAEISDVVEALKKFHPTKIAVESDVATDSAPKLYLDYLAGKQELTRNETQQLGFRLARELGHQTIYPVDTDGDFPFQRVIDYAKASGRSKELDALMGEIGAMVKAQDGYLRSHTVLETLLYMNSDEKVAQDVGYYYREAIFGEPGDWAGADLITEWFRRNARIYANVMQLIDSPDERVLVIFGAGHLGWLRHDFASNPSLRLRKLSEFAK